MRKRSALFFVVLLSILLVGCGYEAEAGRSVWVPYSYSAVFDEDGIQTGWALHEYLLELGPPAQREAGDGTVEIPLDIEVERREVLMTLDWTPPDDLAERGGRVGQK